MAACRSLFATLTRGSGMLHRAFQTYGHYKGPLDKVRKGVLISMAGPPPYLQAVTAFFTSRAIINIASVGWQVQQFFIVNPPGSHQHSMLSTCICSCSMFAWSHNMFACSVSLVNHIQGYQAAMASCSTNTFRLHMPNYRGCLHGYVSAVAQL